MNAILDSWFKMNYKMLTSFRPWGKNYFEMSNYNLFTTHIDEKKFFKHPQQHKS